MTFGTVSIFANRYGSFFVKKQEEIVYLTYDSNVAHRFGANAASVFEHLGKKICDCGFDMNGMKWYRASAPVISTAL